MMASELAEAPAAAILGANGAQVIRAASTPTGLDLPAVLHILAERGITRLLVEGGARLASSFVAAGLADEFWLFRGPNAIGADGVAALGALPLTAITQSSTFHLRASENLGQDTLTVYERNLVRRI
jgi:diaminohydroxyphosphoribosylaminopyrimidine deaminase/5-amino-6-(5-phosphoribosylamino)uracil reductase